jgi:hypothetical protein
MAPEQMFQLSVDLDRGVSCLACEELASEAEPAALGPDDVSRMFPDQGFVPLRARSIKRNPPFRAGFRMGGAGLEPATSCL